MKRSEKDKKKHNIKENIRRRQITNKFYILESYLEGNFKCKMKTQNNILKSSANYLEYLEKKNNFLKNLLFNLYIEKNIYQNVYL